MFALLGEIQFDLITYFDGFESQFGADYAQHALIEGKPRLQFVGDRLDEIRIALAFHQHYCDPEYELGRLKRAVASHQAMAFVLGNGDYKGWFVLTEAQATARHTDNAGTLIALDATITLLEYTGDKHNPLPAPAVLARVPPSAATLTAQGPDGFARAAQAGVGGVRQDVRLAVSSVTQAQSAMRTATSAISFARQLAVNPVAALSRVPGLLNDVKRVADPLIRANPALAALSSQFPQAGNILRATASALDSTRAVQGALTGATTGNISARLGTAVAQMDSARAALGQGAPAASSLASLVTVRRI